MQPRSAATHRQQPRGVLRELRRSQRRLLPVLALLASLLLPGCPPAPEPRPRPEPLDPCAQKRSVLLDVATLRAAVGVTLVDAAAQRLTEAWGPGAQREDHEGDWLVFAAQGVRLLMGDALAGEAGLIKRVEMYAPPPKQRQPWWDAMRQPCERRYAGALPHGLRFGMTAAQVEALLGPAAENAEDTDTPNSADTQRGTEKQQNADMQQDAEKQNNDGQDCVRAGRCVYRQQRLQVRFKDGAVIAVSLP